MWRSCTKVNSWNATRWIGYSRHRNIPTPEDLLLRCRGSHPEPRSLAVAQLPAQCSRTLVQRVRPMRRVFEIRAETCPILRRIAAPFNIAIFHFRSIDFRPRGVARNRNSTFRVPLSPVTSEHVDNLGALAASRSGDRLFSSHLVISVVWRQQFSSQQRPELQSRPSKRNHTISPVST